MDLEPLVDALSDPGAYPDRPAAVELVRTHVSVLFLAGERVYKLKRPVRLPFVDASSLARRRELCDLEVALGRRLAPDVYLGVRPVVLDPGGRVRVGADADLASGAELVDWVVAMRRLPAAGMLDRRLAEGAVDNAWLRRVAEVLARFHAAAERGREVDRCAEPDAVARVVLANFEETRPFLAPGALPGGPLCPPALHAFLERRARAFLAERRALRERRVAEGRAVDGHGDLHAGNVCLEGDRVAIYDPVEFEPAFRRGDAAADVAFLAMDLDRLGYRAASDYFARAYAEAARDPELAAVLPFYKAYRAMVRAKVAAFAAADAGAAPEARAAKRVEGIGYAALAATYALPAFLVVTCGLPATGKSYVARRVAAACGAALHRSDVVRKELAGRALADRRREGYDQGLYTAENKERTYEALLERARDDLARGRSCVVDGSFVKRGWRERFAAAAREAGAPFVLLELHADVATVKARLERRLADPTEASEADFAVYESLAAQYEPPDELPPRQVLPARSADPHEETVAELLVRVAEQAEPRA